MTPVILLLLLCGCGIQVKPPEARGKVPVPAGVELSSSQTVAADTKAKTTEAGEKNNSNAPQQGGQPRLVAEQTVHDFGTMNPRTNGKHTFLVRNEGTADLHFLNRRSSCDCTVGWYPKEPVRPGETAEILVQWHTRLDHGHFRQTTTVVTDDPAHPELELAIEGDVLTHMGAEPPQLGAEDIRPGEPRTFTSVVSSQVWRDFEIAGLETSLEGLQWKIEPASEEQRSAHRAVRSYELTVTIPDNMPVGSFNHWVRLRIDPRQEGASAETYEIPLQGKVLRNLAVYGTGIDSTGTLDLGVIPSHAGLKRRLILKVYDREPQLACSTLESTPANLKMSVTSATPDDPSKGVYYLDIEVPAGSPDCNFVRGAEGRIHLTFDHPRIRTLDLKLLMAVAVEPAAPSAANPASNKPLSQLAVDAR